MAEIGICFTFPKKLARRNFGFINTISPFETFIQHLQMATLCQFRKYR